MKRFLFFIKFLEIRLRFVAILVVTALVVGYWDNIQNYYERWQRNRAAQTQTSPGHEHAASAPATAAESQYEYTCAMHPFVVREQPGKCPICGMDLIKRKKGTQANLPEGTLARVQISPERVMQAGIQVEPIGYRLLSRTVRSYGVVELDETRMAKIVARFPGRVEDLMVNAVGMNVKKDEPLARIYSPKFLAATQEYLQAMTSERKLTGDAQATADEKQRAAQLTSYARQRLLLAGFTGDQLDAIGQARKANENVTLHSPLAGTVLEKNVLQGETVEEGTALYTIADLSTLWVQALVIESDLGAVKLGMPVEVSTVSYPGKIFYGTVNFIYPTLNTDSRSVKVRVVVDNREGQLKPGMYATAVMRSPIGEYGEVGAKEQGQGAAGAKAVKTAKGALVAKAKDAKMKGATAPTKLPTETQAEADRYLATLAPGAEYYMCSMHAEVVSDKPGDCPKCGMHLVKETKKAEPKQAETQVASAGLAAMGGSSGERFVEGYTCPMHPDELSPVGGICKLCGCGMKLKKWRVERVLAVPESAVIDTGTRQVVYVESQPGVYDARAVTLGPRAGLYYPVLDGLTLGQRIASRGSFLIDAEARLNPANAGAGSGSAHQHGGGEGSKAEGGAQGNDGNAGPAPRATPAPGGDQNSAGGMAGMKM